MNRIYKFGFNHRPRVPALPPIGVLWIPNDNLKFPHERLHDYKWCIRSQEVITIEPNACKSIQLKFGIRLALGVVLVSLINDLKLLKCTLANESVVEDCEDVIISIYNNSTKTVTLNEGDIICYLTYINL